MRIGSYHFGRLLSDTGISEAFKAIGKVISESVKTSKNAKPAKGQKQAEKK
ncbi:MAG: hypothetical protein LBJ32_01820 [Oscillospiraceae bacterium]|nr:hypothetical protein [Oscillospiraceae bacterium]